jgi:hypothetical protein
MTSNQAPDPNAPSARRLGTSRPAVLGLSTDAIGDLQVSDLINNVPALKMLLHKYAEYIDENAVLHSRIASLQTELQIYVAYRDGYGQRRSDSRTAATLSFIGTVLVGFGINLSTPIFTTPGIVTLVAGIIVSVMAMFFSLRK